MAKRPTGGTSDAGVPSSSEIPADATPRDLFPTSDIRFVTVELGKLTAQVERLIDDLKSQSGKIDELRHQASLY